MGVKGPGLRGETHGVITYLAIGVVEADLHDLNIVLENGFRSWLLSFSNLINSFRALAIAHNKTLARQFHGELTGFFPRNTVHVFMRCYDNYRPEMYLWKRKLYVEESGKSTCNSYGSAPRPSGRAES